MSAFRRVITDQGSGDKFTEAIVLFEPKGLGSKQAKFDEDLALRVQQLTLSKVKGPGCAEKKLTSARFRSDTPAPSSKFFSEKTSFVTIAQAEERKEQAPCFFGDEVSLTNVRTTIISGYHSYTAFFFIMLCGSPSFVSLMTTKKDGEVENNILKEKIIIPFIKIFQKDGVLDLRYSGYVLTRLNDCMERSKKIVQLTLERTTASIRTPFIDYKRAPSPVMFDSRQVRLTTKDCTKLEEHARKFVARFDRDSFFSSIEIPKEGIASTAQLSLGFAAPLSAKCLLFVRHKGWEPTPNSLVFPSRQIIVNKKSYALKAVSLFTPMEHSLTYKSYIFEGDNIFTHYSCYVNSPNQECYQHEFTPAEIEATKPDFFSETSSATPALKEFVFRIMQFSEMFVYEESIESL